MTLKIKSILCACLLGLFMAGCDSQEDMLKAQVDMLQKQVKGWQEHYLRLMCVQDALNSLESLDQALENGLSLATYQQKIVAVNLVLESTGCEAREPLTQIMALHQLAANIWEARNNGKLPDMAEDLVTKVYPLWQQFEYPWPEELPKDLEQAFADYAQASGPQGKQYLDKIKTALAADNTMAPLASIANQLIWHQAHNQLVEFKNRLTTPPYPLQ